MLRCYVLISVDLLPFRRLLPQMATTVFKHIY